MIIKPTQNTGVPAYVAAVAAQGYEDFLRQKYNKNIYRSPTADSINGSYLQIGPLVYGGEVQDIKIFEQKAVEENQGVRTGRVFLTDSGEGRADVQVTMIFSGMKHILDGLVPLIALFKVSPITSVQNKVISGALLDKFTEGNVSMDPTKDSINYIDKVLGQAEYLREVYAIKNLIYPPGKKIELWEITETEFQLALKNGYNTIYKSAQDLTERLKNNRSYFQPNVYTDVHDSSPGAKAATEEATKLKFPNSRFDKSGYVPMALMSLETETHPEFTNTLIVTVGLRRIHVRNFARDGLYYRSLNNTPTPDARNAFWLNRAIDLYIAKYATYANDQTNTKAFVANSTDGKVLFRYTGEDVLLKRFVDKEKIKEILFQSKYNPDNNHSVVTQISGGIRNKFAFHRMSGESFPTAQFLGSTSSQVNIGIRTKSDEFFKEIHTFKSAADFFLRSIDRSDRFSGWTVDTLITRLFNSRENPSYSGGLSSAYFPTSSVSSTVSDLPGVRDIAVSFSETSTDFFSDFGFVLYTNGVTTELLHKFYLDVIKKAVGKDASKYCQKLLFGRGKITEQFSVLNPDSFVAGLIERQGFKDGYIQFVAPVSQGASALLKDLQLNPIFNGVENGEITMWEAVRQAKDVLANLGGVAGETISLETARLLANDTFQISAANAGYFDPLVDLIRNIPENQGRRELYVWLMPKLAEGVITIREKYYDQLFAAIVNRKETIVSDRLYSRVSVANAFDTLQRGLHANLEAVDDKDLADDFNKSKAITNALLFTTEGGFSVEETRSTSYPDWMYITYREMFDLPELEADNWKNYGYTYQDLGIINPDIKSFNADQTAELNSDSVSRAQTVGDRALATTPTSPVPPSIFFSREAELADLRTNLSKQTKEWHDNVLKKFTIHIPYDVEFLLKDINNKFDGTMGIIDTDGTIKNIDALSYDQKVGLATMIERGNTHLTNDTPGGGIDYKQVAEDIITARWRLARDKFAPGLTTDTQFRDWYKQLPDQGATGLTKAAIRNWMENVDLVNPTVPLIYAGHMNQMVAGYRRITGTIGSASQKTLIDQAVKITGIDYERMMTETLNRAAANLDDGRTLNNTGAPDLHNALLKSSMCIADNRNDMIKAFPAFRLYLIDYSKGDRIFVKDNFYGWNAILSIDITLDKNDSDLAVIRIADPMHILQGDIFEDKVTLNKGVIGKFVLPNSPDDLSENFLARFALKQGRAVQIRAGYSADPDNLDIVFTGRIAEVEFGDIVTIVAQGWKAELVSKQVDFQLTSVKNSSVKDLVVRTIQDAEPAGFGVPLSQQELIQYSNIAADSGLDVDGAFERSAQNQYNTYGGESGYQGTRGTLGLHLFGALGRGLDLRLKNVWAPDNEKSRFNYWADIDTSGWEGRQWLVPLQPAWDVLQNATNYIWGYICQTVPYDGEATLFFGRPEQLYYYKKGNPKEETLYRNAKHKALTDLKETSLHLLERFLRSPEYSGKGIFSTLLPDHEDVINSILTMRDRTDQDGLLGSLFIRTRNSKLVREITPADLGLTDYIKFYHYQSHDSVFTDTPVVNFSENQLSRVSYFIRNNLTHTFKGDLEVLNAKFGEANAAYILLSSFYGFSEDYISKNLYPGTSTVNGLVQPFVASSLSSLRRRLQESLQNLEAINASNVTFGFLDIDQSTAAQYYNALESAPGKIYKEFQFSNLTKQSRIRNQSDFLGTGQHHEFWMEYTGTDTIIAKHFVEAIAGYVNNTHSAKFFLPDTEARCYATINDDSFRIVFDQPIAKYSPEDLLQRIATVALSAFQNSSVKRDHASVFDPQYKAFAETLGAANPVDNNPTSTDLTRYVVESIPAFRAYVHWLAEWIKTVESDTKSDVESIHQNLSASFPPALNMKPFRDYHYLANGVEIIENNVAASTREMANTVIVRGQKSVKTDNDSWWKPHVVQGDYDEVNVEDVEWGIWPSTEEAQHMGLQFNDQLTLENKKVTVFSDINIDLSRRDQCAKVATNVLAKAIRPMYRNNILVMGRAIKPWDQFFLDDKYTDMFGHMEVERIVHHYSVNEGWVTNIVPHAIVEANPGSSVLQRAILANQIDKIYNTIDVALWAITILTAMPALRAALGLTVDSLGVGGAKLLKSKATPDFILENFGGKKLIQAFGEGRDLGSQLVVLRDTVFADAIPAFRALYYAQLAESAVGEVTRAFALNAGGRITKLPVVVSPVTFKGAPLEAGLNGQESEYFSLTSKLHWYFQDLRDGVREIGRSIQDIQGVSNNAKTLNDLEQIRSQFEKPR